MPLLTCGNTIQIAGLYEKASVSAAETTTLLRHSEPQEYETWTMKFSQAQILTTDNPEPAGVPLVNEAISQGDNPPLRKKIQKMKIKISNLQS